MRWIVLCCGWLFDLSHTNVQLEQTPHWLDTDDMFLIPTFYFELSLKASCQSLKHHRQWITHKCSYKHTYTHTPHTSVLDHEIFTKGFSKAIRIDGSMTMPEHKGINSPLYSSTCPGPLNEYALAKLLLDREWMCYWLHELMKPLEVLWWPLTVLTSPDRFLLLICRASSLWEHALVLPAGLHVHHFEYFGRNEQRFKRLKMESSWAEAADTGHVDHGKAELESKIL